MHRASVEQWGKGFSGSALDAQLARFYGEDQVGPWRERYLEALRAFAGRYGREGEVVIARCPGQMNLMGMHIDYGGMPSLRLAVRGADTITLARSSNTGRVRLASLLRHRGESEDRFAPIEFDLGEILPRENVGTRQALMEYAGRVCQERQERTGRVQDDDWAVLVQGQLIYLESYFRGKVPFRGFDGLVWSNVSPRGGMSSSSALVISTACAALGAHDLRPGVELSEEDLVDGVGTSEWIRGTRGGTADHGGMVMGRAGYLVSVGVFPARPCGRAPLPAEYAAVVLDSGVPRVYDDAVKEETVIAYPLGTFMVRELLLPRMQGQPGFEGLVPDFRQRLALIRDITQQNLGIELPALYRLLKELPVRITLRELEKRAVAANAQAAYQAMYRLQVQGKFQHVNGDFPVFLRRRFCFGLAEQDRVRGALEYMNGGDLATVLELVRISHEGDLDREVTDEDLEERRTRAARGEPRARLCFLPGGYGRMTPQYDRVVRTINEYLLSQGGPEAGAVQRLGAGWGGNLGGLVRREFIAGKRSRDFARLLREELDLEADLEKCMAAPGQGACLLEIGEEVR